MPAFLARENENKVPVGALWLTNVVIQLFLIVTFFAEVRLHDGAQDDELDDADSLPAGRGLRAEARLDRRDLRRRRGSRSVDWVRGAIATVYAAGMLYAGGAKFIMLSALLYAPGTILFVIARREQNRPVFTRVEWLMFGVIVAVAAAGLYSLASGMISI